MSNAGYDYKNSISNGGFFQIAARLARFTGNASYVEWAEKIWDWTEGIGLMSNTYDIFDGTDTVSIRDPSINLANVGLENQLYSCRSSSMVVQCWSISVWCSNAVKLHEQYPNMGRQNNGTACSNRLVLFSIHQRYRYHVRSSMRTANDL